jgi:hypothetical protein
MRLTRALAGCILLMGCPPPPLDTLENRDKVDAVFAWTVSEGVAIGNPSLNPVPVTTDRDLPNTGKVSLDPTLPFRISLEASSVDGVATVTLSGQGTSVTCHAASSSSGLANLSFPLVTATKNPAAPSAFVFITFPQSTGPQATFHDSAGGGDIGVIGCGITAIPSGLNVPYDAWSGMLVFTGTASSATKPYVTRAVLTVTLKPPTP